MRKKRKIEEKNEGKDIPRSLPFYFFFFHFLFLFPFLFFSAPLSRLEQTKYGEGWGGGGHPNKRMTKIELSNGDPSWDGLGSKALFDPSESHISIYQHSVTAFGFYQGWGSTLSSPSPGFISRFLRHIHINLNFPRIGMQILGPLALVTPVFFFLTDCLALGKLKQRTLEPISFQIAASSCPRKDFLYLRDNITEKALDGQVINRHKVVTALQCSDFCLREPGCYGFNLETMKEKKICELLGFGSTIVDRPGYRYWIFDRVLYEQVTAYPYI